MKSRILPDRASKNTARAELLPWALLVLTMVLGIAAAVLIQLNQAGPGQESAQNFYGDIFYLFSAIVGAAIGVLILQRRRRNLIAWLLLGIGAIQAAQDFLGSYATYAFITRPGTLPESWVPAWLSQWMWPLPFIALGWVLLIYPTGELLSPRWRWAGRAATIGTVGLILSLALASTIFVGNGNPPLSVRNPVGFIDTDFITSTEFPLLYALVLAAVFVALVSLIVRFRRSRGDERQQLKWFTYAAVIAVLTSAVANWLLGPWASVAQNLAFLLLPLAIGTAILRYRLYDIDILINRTLVYLPLTGILAGIFAASIALTQRLFLVITGSGSEAATVLTTLIVVAAFEPVKTTLQHVVDRRFKEAPDPTKRLKAFDQQVLSFIQVADPNEIVKRLLEETCAAFEARGGAFLKARGDTLEVSRATGEWDGHASVSVPLEESQTGARIGVLALGARKNGADYTAAEREILEKSARDVARAVLLNRGLSYEEAITIALPTAHPTRSPAPSPSGRAR